MERKGFIGGSDIAAVMGMHPFVTPLELWAEKTGILESKDLTDNEAVEIGIELEEFVAKKFAKKSGKKIRRDSRDFAYEKDPRLKAHIDRWVIGGELLECKTASAYLAKKWEGEDIPIEYIMQVQWYLGILKMRKGWIACLIGGQKFVWKEVLFDEALFKVMVERAIHFLDVNVAKNEAPMACAEDSDVLFSLHPMGEGKLVFKDDKEIEVNQLVDIKKGGMEQIKIIEKEVDEAKNKLKQMLGDYEYAETGQYRIIWKNQQSKRVDVEKIKASSLYETYSKVTNNRVLRTPSNIQREK